MLPLSNKQTKTTTKAPVKTKQTKNQSYQRETQCIKSLVSKRHSLCLRDASLCLNRLLGGGGGGEEIQCTEKTAASMAESMPSIKAAKCSGQSQANKEGSSAGVGIPSGGY